MKKIYLLIGLFLWIQFGFAQKTTYEFFAGVAFSSVIGGSGYNSDGSQEFQTGHHIGYVNGFTMKNCDAVELGIFFQQNRLQNHPFSSGISQYSSTTKNFIWIPLNYRFNFKHNFYFKSGVVALMDLSKKDNYFRKYSGLGIGVSGGKGFEIAANQLIEISPYFNFHSLINFKNHPYRMLDLGVQLV